MIITKTSKKNLSDGSEVIDVVIKDEESQSSIVIDVIIKDEESQSSMILDMKDLSSTDELLDALEKFLNVF